MNEYYENIKNKTVYTDCGSKEMALGYMWEANGIVKKHVTMMGASSFKGTSNMMLIVCTKCGLVNKSYVFAR